MSRKKLTEIGNIFGLADRIKMVRSDLTQEEFGKALGVRKSTISRYESGRIPDPIVLQKIAAYAQTTVDWLLFGEKGQILENLRQNFLYNFLGEDISWWIKDNALKNIYEAMLALRQDAMLLNAEIKRLRQDIHEEVSVNLEQKIRDFEKEKTADAATRLMEEAQLELGINLRPEQKQALLKMVRPALDSQRRAVKDTILSFYSQETK